MPTHGLKGLYNEDFFLAVFVERLRTHVKLYELADARPFLCLNQLLIVKVWMSLKTLKEV